MKKTYNVEDPKSKFMDTNNKMVDQGYSYYSRLLKEPFDSVEELQLAEEAYYAKLKAKEAKAATKKADADKVQDAFVNLNAARRSYKEDLTNLATKYSEDLVALKKAFESSRDRIRKNLADAEETYAAAIRAFTEKYPEGYHITLKDGDFETTISGSNHKSQPVGNFDFVNWLFNL